MGVGGGGGPGSRRVASSGVTWSWTCCRTGGGWTGFGRCEACSCSGSISSGVGGSGTDWGVGGVGAVMRRLFSFVPPAQKDRVALFDGGQLMHVRLARMRTEERTGEEGPGVWRKLDKDGRIARS